MTDLEIAATDLDAMISLLKSKSWRERLFLTDREAIGEPLTDGANKGKAVEHQGGALARFASEGSLRHLQTAGFITSTLVRKLDSDLEPSRGRMRLWSLDDILKAELAFSVAELADLPLLTTVAILQAIPGRLADPDGHRPDIASDLASTWATYIAGQWLASNPDHELFLDGRALVKESPDRPDKSAPQQTDVRLALVDRRWVLGWGLQHPLIFDPEPWPLLEVKSFQNAAPEVDAIIFDQDNQQEPGRRVETARMAMTHPVCRLEINLTEPLRRFLHRNR